MRYYRVGSGCKKNYIYSYYHKGVALAWWAAVVRLQGSGTTVDAYGTTVDPGAVLPQPQQQPVKGGRKNGGSSKEEGGDKRRHVRDDSTQTFPTRTPS